VEFQVIRKAFWRIFSSSSSIGKKKTEEIPTLKLNIVNGSSGSNPERIDLIMYFRFTNRGKYLQILGLEIWGQKVVLEEGWRHIASKSRKMSRCL
jgi:hypothetical protein